MAEFEDRLAALEDVVERLERGELSLDESVRLFEQGVKLSNSCKAELEKAEGRIQVLVEAPDGKMEAVELDLEQEQMVDDEDEEDEEEEEE